MTRRTRKYVTLARDVDARAAGRGELLREGTRLHVTGRNTYLTENGDYVDRHYYGYGAALRVRRENLVAVN